MRYIIPILLVTCLSGCGQEDDEQKTEVAPERLTTPELRTEPPSEPSFTGRPESDFSGMIDLDERGFCSVNWGEDNDYVSCEIQIESTTNRPVVTLKYRDLALLRKPVCLVQTTDKVSGTARVRKTDSDRLEVEIAPANAKPNKSNSNSPELGYYEWGYAKYWPPMPAPPCAGPCKPCNNPCQVCTRPNNPCNRRPTCPPIGGGCKPNTPKPKLPTGTILSFYCKTSG